MRRSIDGLSKEAKAFGAGDEGLFVFVNRRRDRLKVLWRDRTGWCLLYKRLNGDRLVRLPSGDEEQVRIDAATLAFLLDGVSKNPTEREIRQEADEKVRSLLAKRRYNPRRGRSPQRAESPS
jgi:transposase